MAKKERFDYFDAFGKQAGKAILLADLLTDTLENFTTAVAISPVLHTAHDIENSADEINHKIHDAVAVDFITPVNREDILALANALDSVCDEIEAVIQRCYMHDIRVLHDNAIPFAKLIQAACRELCDAMDDFRHFKKSKDFKEHIVEINRLEEEGDIMLLKSIRSLYKDDGGKDPMRCLVWKEIFERLERSLDATKHVADAMVTILLKNS